MMLERFTHDMFELRRQHVQRVLEVAQLAGVKDLLTIADGRVIPMLLRPRSPENRSP
jgi:hypothetical protein